MLCKHTLFGQTTYLALQVVFPLYLNSPIGFFDFNRAIGNVVIGTKSLNCGPEACSAEDRRIVVKTCNNFFINRTYANETYYCGILNICRTI